MNKCIVTKTILGFWMSVACIAGGKADDRSANTEGKPIVVVRGLTGTVTGLRIAIEAPQTVTSSAGVGPQKDIDLKRMAQWAMNYLIRTPRKELDYEPVFQCNPLKCPPVPKGHDVIVPCDTDARMEWEWYYMREISGSNAGRDVEAAFHKRIRDYIDTNGVVWAPPGAYLESLINNVYGKEDYIIHTWGATKILKSLSEEYTRTKNPETKQLARKVMLGLKRMATWDTHGRCWYRQGMGALKADRSVVSNTWNLQPAPLVEPLVVYYLATGDNEALDFAKAYVEGMMANCQPGGIRFDAHGIPSGGLKCRGPNLPPTPHSHATMHAVWGVAHLGIVTGEQKYVDFAKGAFDWLLAKGTGTGWFPEGPDNRNETCVISDMMSVASLVARAGRPEYYDYVERYLRNYISPLQFIFTPEFETYYRSLHKDKSTEEVDASLAELQKFQGGVIGISGLNDYENELLGPNGFRMTGCCAPEGMRAIYTTWSNVIERLPQSTLGPAGIYVNMCFSRESPWGQVVSFFPHTGRLTVKAAVRDRFLLRPPHWTPRHQVRAFVGSQAVPVQWSGHYVSFDNVNPGDELTIAYPLVSFSHNVDGLWSGRPQLRMKFQWLGNMVLAANPAAQKTPLFIGKPRLLPVPPLL
jgi:hypothetical protein